VTWLLCLLSENTNYP